jgi:hypothetical protein
MKEDEQPEMGPGAKSDRIKEAQYQPGKADRLSVSPCRQNRTKVTEIDNSR